MSTRALGEGCMRRQDGPSVFQLMNATLVVGRDCLSPPCLPPLK